MGRANWVMQNERSAERKLGLGISDSAFADFHLSPPLMRRLLTFSERERSSRAPQTESQYRPITKLDPEDVPAVWHQVLDEAPIAPDGSKIITAKLIKAIVDRWLADDDDEKADDDLFDVEGATKDLLNVLHNIAATWPAGHHEVFAQSLRRVAREIERPRAK